MSYTQSFHDQARAIVMSLASGANPRPPDMVLQALNAYLSDPNSPLMNNMIQWLDQQTGGRWRNGINQNDLANVLRRWTGDTLGVIQQNLVSQGRLITPMMGGYPGGMYPPAGGQMYPVVLPGNPSSGIYDVGTTSPQQQIVMPPSGRPSSGPSNIGAGAQNYDFGRKVVIEISTAPTADFTEPALGGALNVAHYMTGEFENARLLTSEITLLMAQNKPVETGRLVQKLAPQEVIRGTYVNVIHYNELFHIPMPQPQFNEIIKAVEPVIFHKDRDWKQTLRILRKREYDDFKCLSDTICRLFNISIYRRLRLSTGEAILGIDTIDDLIELDDRDSELKVAQHPNYMYEYNMMVVRILRTLFDPKHLIGPDDPNFGDFIACDQIMIYNNGKTKYDYGTIRDREQYDRFVGQMLAQNTVVRIPRSIVITNALSPYLISDVKAGDVDSQKIVSSINTVGTALLRKTEFLKSGEVYALICMDKSKSPDSYCERINLGRTLDEDLVLLP